MNFPVRALLWAVLVLAPSIANAQNVEAGRKAFAVCKACHDVGEAARSKIGPPLNGLFGHRAASVQGFPYSDALKRAGIVWDEATFRQYMTSPRTFVPGTKMAYAGMKTDTAIADVAAYLKSFDANGKATVSVAGATASRNAKPTPAAPAPALLPGGWQEYRPDDASFRVEMPRKPIAGTRNLESGDGQMHYAVLRVGKGVLGTNYSEMAASRVGAPSDQNFAILRDVEIKSIKARLVGEQAEVVDGYPARRLTFDPANGLIITQRIVLVKSRVYQIISTGPPGYAESPDSVRFLNSFKVLKP